MLRDLACMISIVGLSVGLAAGEEIRTQTYTYKQVENCDIKADVYSYAKAGKQPAVVMIHGGALIMGQRHMLGNDVGERIVRRFLDAGFKVVSIDYRLAPETKLPAIIEDLRDAFG